MLSTRAGRCCYVFHARAQIQAEQKPELQVSCDLSEQFDKAIESVTDPIAGSPDNGKTVSGVICLHVDDILCVGDEYMYLKIVATLRNITE